MAWNERAENVLRESEKSVRRIVDGIPGLVTIMTPEGEVEFVNNQALEYFGRTLEEFKRWATSDAVCGSGRAGRVTLSLRRSDAA